MPRILAVIAAMAALWSAAATAQTYPTKPVTMVVAYAAGGPTDTIARLLAERMGRSLGQTVIVENVSGAAGTIGTAKAARAAPDGYTIAIGHWGTHVVNGALYANLTYHPFDDFAPIAMVTTGPQMIVSHPSVPAKDLKELVAWVKANGDKVTAATSGIGAGSHVSGVYFNNMVGGKIQFVPYRGAAPAMQDLLSGQVQLMFDQAANSLPQVRAGKVRAYAITARTRSPAMPDIPTVDEAGLPGYHVAVWHALWLPKGAPDAVVERLNTAVREALDDPQVAAKLATLGQDLPTAEQRTPAGLRAHHKAEIELWWPLIKAAGIKIE
ncbi:MAG: tripartite tricarboxylate transporter substrate binding protein BugD [Rhodospirillales bacterium]|nr:tripartite tricarboxylate transporter substrate binding protein BugD [Rhodospirillales bacterium]